MSVAGRDNLVDSIATAFANSRPTPFMVGWSRPSRTWLRAKRWMETPSLGYITLLRDGARAHSLPETHIWFLESVEHAQ